MDLQFFFYCKVVYQVIYVKPWPNGGGYFASLLARASSHKLRASFCELRKIPAQKSKNGHYALIWYLLHAGWITSGEIGLLTKSNLALTSLYSFFRIRYISKEKCGLNRFVKNGRVRKFWLTKITGPLPEVIPNILVRITHRNFRNLWANICGFHVLMHCSMESEVMKCFPLFFYFYQSSMLLNYQNLVL